VTSPDPVPAAGTTARWAGFASSLRHEDLPASLLEVLKGLVLDTAGCALAATSLGDGRDAVRSLSLGGSGEATLWGWGGRSSAAQAAFANGALAHALNFDANGVHGGHVGLASVVTPLVAAEWMAGRGRPVSGRELLAGVAVAAEFTSRLAAALHAAGVDANERFLEGQLLGYFGAAAGAGRVAGLDAARMHSALGLALMQAAGTRQVSFEGGEAKAIYGGFANQGAMQSMLLADNGLDARCDALEGKAGLYGLFYGGRHDAAVLAADLGRRFLCGDAVFKTSPASAVLHPFIAAGAALRGTLGADRVGAITAIHLRAGAHCRVWLEPLAARMRPASGATASNSIPFALGKALSSGGFTLGDLDAAGLADPQALRLAALVGYELDGRAGEDVEVRVQLADGTALGQGMDAGGARPNFSQLASKFIDCAGRAARPMNGAAVREFIDRVAALEREPDAAAIARLLGGSGSAAT
jgi:2-methylcitrate dehydratase PrpD